MRLTNQDVWNLLSKNRNVNSSCANRNTTAFRCVLFAGITLKLNFFHTSICRSCRRNFQRGKIYTCSTSIGKRQGSPDDVLFGQKRRRSRRAIQLVHTERGREFRRRSGNCAIIWIAPRQGSSSVRVVCINISHQVRRFGQLQFHTGCVETGERNLHENGADLFSGRFGYRSDRERCYQWNGEYSLIYQYKMLQNIQSLSFI